MKLVFKTLIASVSITSALLTACGKSGGTASTPTSTTNTTAACTYDASGNCTLQIGPAGNIGAGLWQGSLNVNNLGILQQLAADNGICAMNTTINNFGPNGSQNLANYNCSSIIQQVAVQVALPNGCVPGFGQFAIGFYSGNGQMQPLRVTRAQAYQNTASNGFFLTYQSGSNNQFGNQFGLTQASTTQLVSGSSLQIQLEWTDGTHNTENIQMFYKGQQFASGQIGGQANVSNLSTSTTACSGIGGFGNGFGVQGGFGLSSGLGWMTGLVGGGIGQGFGGTEVIYETARPGFRVEFGERDWHANRFGERR